MATSKALQILGALLLVSGCSDATNSPSPGDKPGRTHETVQSKIRPTDGMGWHGNGYGNVKAYSHASKGGHFKVWYTKKGDDAVPLEDTSPKDGVPDFVNKVAKHAETSYSTLVDEVGFREPLDDSKYHDRPDYGGDARFDIYLLNVNDSDGYRVVEACRSNPPQCAGYLAMENDFKGFNYPSKDFAIKVLTSHEFTHAIHGAYLADIPRFWSEGTATWAEERVFPEQGDFDNFLHVFFRNPDRPLNAEQAGNPGDPFPYSTAIWPKFLEERFGDAVIVDTFEELAKRGKGADVWAATDAVLQNEGASVGEAFSEFALWNALTGSRASATDEEIGYENAANYPVFQIGAMSWSSGGGEVLASKEFSQRHLTASQFELNTGEHGGETVELRAYGRLRFAVLPVAGGKPGTPTFLRPAGGLDREEIRLPNAGKLYIAAANAETLKKELDGELEIRETSTSMGGDAGPDAGMGDAGADSDTGPPAGDAFTPDAGANRDDTGVTVGGGGEGSSKSGCTSSGGDSPLPLALVAVVVFAAGFRTRRRF